MRCNFLQAELFEFRFKRKPNMWTIEQVHDLWTRACERGSKRQADITSCIKNIVKEIPKNDKGQHIVYFYYKNDTHVSSYTFTYHHNFKSHGYITDTVRFSKDKVVARDEKLDFILSKERAFEMGQEFYSLKKMETSLHCLVMNIMWEMVENKLRKQFKESTGYIYY